ncbi:unnamed protein product, partial [Pocillopora meandrina]
MFQIPEAKLAKLKRSLESMILAGYATYRELARLAGFIISLSLAVGPIARLFTRQMYFFIQSRPSWDVSFTFSEALLQELKFWLQHINSFNGYSIRGVFSAESTIYTDASDFAFGGYLATLGGEPVRGMFSPADVHSSSTYRELKAVFYCSVFSCSSISSDISKVGVWKEAWKLSHPELSIQVPHLLDLVLASNAPSTTSRYSYGWARWRRWTQSKQGIAGLESPTEHPTVIAAAEGARRKLSMPVRPKQPLDLETVVRVAQYYNTALASLADIRFLFVFLVGYAGLFRISELLSVKIIDITIVHDGMSIFVSKRKNDQFREGHTSIIARSGKVSCPVSITERLLVLLASPKESCSPVLRRIVRTKNGAYFHKSLGISYSTIRDEFKKYVSPFVNDPSDYCLH